MLKVIENIGQLKFYDLMQVYEESNLAIGAGKYPLLSKDEQLREAEQDFYQYLLSVFFKQSYCKYAIWEEKSQYCSAVRLEPYQDGILLCSLETAPALRRKGYAKQLLLSLQGYLCGKKIYSHISKGNAASIAVHKSCGFQIIKEYAVHVDGSVFRDSITMLYQSEKTESC